MSNTESRIFCINLGSTSTKVAYWEGETCLVRDSILHDSAELASFESVFDQKLLREKTILAWMEKHGLELDVLDAIVTRGPQTEAIAGGVWQVSPAMAAQGLSGIFGTHVCSLGSAIVLDFCAGRHALPLTVDTPSTDEFDQLARYTGLPEIVRESHFQALNARAQARAWASSQGKAYEQTNIVTVMLGGGVTCVAHKQGRMVDGTDGLEGDGCFSNNRCNGIPVGALVHLCYSGDYSERQMMRHVNGEAGLAAYLGETDLRAIEAKIEAGDEYAREVLSAMCYQIAKDAAGMAAVLEGDVDAVVLTGGMANDPFIVDELERRLGFIAPVAVLPGEREMESLAAGARAGLAGEVPIQLFVPSVPGVWDYAVEPVE